MPFEYLRWTLAERYGWTLEQVDSLTMKDLEQWFQVQDGINKARGK